MGERAGNTIREGPPRILGAREILADRETVTPLPRGTWRILPTKYQADPDGPLHSWRVLLVPHAGKSFKERFSNYDFDQEWNSLTNHHALYEMPGFNFFGMEEGNASLADFLAISGTNWPVERAQLKRPLPTYLVTKGEDRFLLVYDLNTMEHQK
ncbi:MAG: hypothetical protein ACI9OD_003529 [Limisphaerales bacterium]